MKATLIKVGVCALAVLAMAGCQSSGGGGGGGASDEDIIRGHVEAAMAALVAQDIDAMTANYADDFTSDQGGGVAEMREFLKGAQEQGFLDDVEVDLSELTITIDGDKAKAEPLNLEGAFGALTLELEFTKRDGQWVVTYSAQY